jgi:hypothetical protein
VARKFGLNNSLRECPLWTNSGHQFISDEHNNAQQGDQKAPFYIGGATPSLPTVIRSALKAPSESLVAPGMNTFAFGFSSLRSPGTKATTFVLGVVVTVLVPPLQWPCPLWPRQRTFDQCRRLGHVRLGSKADLQDILNVFVATGVMVLLPLGRKILKWVTRSPQGQSFPLRARSLLARALASSSAR